MFRSIKQSLVGVGFLMATALLSSSASAQFIGPYPNATTPYQSFADSPFNGDPFSYFFLEDFEDHQFNVPGVNASTGGVTSAVFGPGLHDSVDADDGAIDGSGLRGDSYFASNGSQGITFTFDKTALGALPTHAGLVWTDGLGNVTFEAFDQNGVSLGTIGGSHANGSFNGEADDDRFYGIINTGGLSAIRISNSSSGIEIDHLQYGLQGATPPVPEPGLPATLVAMGLVGTCFYVRRNRA